MADRGTVRRARRRRMSDDTILETRALTKEFKGFVAVKNVSLKVRRGSIHALIGPNGAGKTTLLKLLLGLLEPTAGSVRRDGVIESGFVVGFVLHFEQEIEAGNQVAAELGAGPFTSLGKEPVAELGLTE